MARGFGVSDERRRMLLGVLGLVCGALLALCLLSPAALAASWAQGVEASLPATAGSNPQIQLKSVSCASAGNCTAVGQYSDSSENQHGVLLIETNGTWAPGVEPSLPANASSSTNYPGAGVDLQSVSCTSAATCTVVGRYVDSSGHYQGLLLTESGGTWGPGVEASLPANASSNPAVDLSSVSCASAGNCTAVGIYNEPPLRQQGLLLTETNGTWGNGVEATLPANALYDVNLGSVSCASAGNCSAVGAYLDSAGHQQGLLLTEPGGTWGPGVAAGLPANASASASYPGSAVGVRSVSCASAGNCSAVGSYVDSASNPHGLLVTETNGTWAPGVEASSPGNSQSELSSVSCPSAGNCTAVGNSGVLVNPTNYHATSSNNLLLNETGGTWAAGVEAAAPGNAQSELGSVSCASAGNCTAVGHYFGYASAGIPYSQGLLASESGGRWAPGAQATPPTNAALHPNVYLTSVSCASGGNYCSAVGSYTDSAGHPQGLLVSTAAVLSGLRVSPRTFVLSGRRVNGRCVTQTAKNRTHRPCARPVKMTVSYQLDFPAQVTITIKRVLPGRLSKGRCVAPTRKNRKHRRCTRLVPVRGSLTKSGAQGSNSFTFHGRPGGHKLGAGTYQLTATPGGGRAQTVTFRIAG